MNIAGFYRFDVHFFDGAEQNAHGFVYAENYANAVEKVYDMVEDEDIADIKIEGMEPGEVLLMPDWIADKIVKYDYFNSDYVREDKNVQFKNADFMPTAEELSKSAHIYDKERERIAQRLDKQTQDYIIKCVEDNKPTPPFENDEVMKEIEKHLTNGNYGPSDKLPLSQQSIDYINECIKNGLPIEMPSHHGEE